MNKIWLFAPNLPYEMGVWEWLQGCRLINHKELSRARPSAGEFARGDFPVAQLELTLEYFAADCFSKDSHTFVSQDFRNAVALGPQDLQYIPVDSSLSAPLPRSKNYMIMHVPVVDNVSDMDQSAYTKARTPGKIDIVQALSIAIRPDAEPKHEMFQYSFFPNVSCTDKLAVRVGLTVFLNQSDRDYCMTGFLSRGRANGLEVCGAGGR